MKSGGYSEGVTITKKLKISSAKVGEGIISSDTVPFFLVSREEGKSMAERTLLLPSRMTQTVAEAAERQRRRFINRATVDRAIRSLRESYDTATLREKADLQPLAPASF